MSAPTTRRYPRSLAEAFPAEHACAIEVYRAPWRFKDALRAVVCVAACVAIGSMLAWGF